MMYRLEKNSKGMITSQVRDGEGGNIYANREAINKQALKNLKKNTPSGKLGKLGDLQIFNFNISDFGSTTDTNFYQEYNSDPTVSINDCVMFSNGKSGDGLYYNILDVKANLRRGAQVLMYPDSYIEFYLLQNGTQPTGKKIPRQQPLFGSVTAAPLTITTDGYLQGNQYLSTNIGQDTQSITTNSLGLRASGIGLKAISINSDVAINFGASQLNIMVYVDNSSVSRSF